MFGDEGIFEMNGSTRLGTSVKADGEPNAVAFYSNTGQSEAIANYFARALGYGLTDITKPMDIRNGERIFYKNLVMVFPVHCQNIPIKAKEFLRSVNVENLTVIATYGKMSYGNVLREVQRKCAKNVSRIVAAAYVPTKHSYINGDESFDDFAALAPIVDKIRNPSKIVLPRTRKNIFADFFPKWRSQVGLRIYKTADCVKCGLCGEGCSVNGIEFGDINGNCIRCVKCVKNCPRGALKIKIGLPLKFYLHKKKVDKLVIYV